MNAISKKHVQLDLKLFLDLYVYACRHSDPDDLQFQRICSCAQVKLEAILRHELYSVYKSGTSEEVRKEARRKYLEAIGLQDSFCWPDNQDVNVTHSFLETP